MLAVTQDLPLLFPFKIESLYAALSWVKLSVFLACFCVLDEVFERWSHISVDTRKEAGQRMKVCAFWLPILLQREESSATACWAFQIGLIDSK